MEVGKVFIKISKIRRCTWEEIVLDVLHTFPQLKVQHSTGTWKLLGRNTSLIEKALKWICTQQNMQFGIYASFNGTLHMYIELHIGIVIKIEACEIIKLATIIKKKLKNSNFH